MSDDDSLKNDCQVNMRKIWKEDGSFCPCYTKLRKA
jgi:hypothetical protein